MNIEIANRLAKLRKEKGYSQEELNELHKWMRRG